MSLSARRAWIEIRSRISCQPFQSVALRKESVDRNKNLRLKILCQRVALRKESVDRNKGPEELAQFWSSSLSARRAWIEINASPTCCARYSVALRKESVDRNVRLPGAPSLWPGSLSARRAWIEIPQKRERRRKNDVALRKESVDRNFFDIRGGIGAQRRSPQGERG